MTVDFLREVNLQVMVNIIKKKPTFTHWNIIYMSWSNNKQTWDRQTYVNASLSTNWLEIKRDEDNNPNSSLQ